MEKGHYNDKLSAPRLTPPSLVISPRDPTTTYHRYPVVVRQQHHQYPALTSLPFTTFYPSRLWIAWLREGRGIGIRGQAAWRVFPRAYSDVVPKDGLSVGAPQMKHVICVHNSFNVTGGQREPRRIRIVSSVDEAYRVYT